MMASTAPTPTPTPIPIFVPEDMPLLSGLGRGVEAEDVVADACVGVRVDVVWSGTVEVGAELVDEDEGSITKPRSSMNVPFPWLQQDVSSRSSAEKQHQLPSLHCFTRGNGLVPSAESCRQL